MGILQITIERCENGFLFSKKEADNTQQFHIAKDEKEIIALVKKHIDGLSSLYEIQKADLTAIDQTKFDIEEEEDL